MGLVSALCSAHWLCIQQKKQQRQTSYLQNEVFKDHGAVTKLKWQTSGCSHIFLAINHGKSVRGCWKYMLSCESQQRRDQLLLPRSGLRNDDLFVAISPGCCVLAVLVNGPLVAVISALNGRSAALFLCSLFKFCKLHEPAIT